MSFEMSIYSDYIGFLGAIISNNYEVFIKTL